MVLKQRFADGRTQFIDIGNNFVIITPAHENWNMQKVMNKEDVHSIIEYVDYNSHLQVEPLYKDFLQWIYSNDGQLFLTLTSPEYPNRPINPNS